MTQLRTDLESSLPLARSLQEARAGIPMLTEDIVAQIQQEVPAYAGGEVGERHRIITMAVSAAITQFLDLLDGRALNPRVDALFWQMGRGEAQDGHTLEPMRDALHIAHRRCWGQLSEFAVRHQISGSLLAELGDAVFSYLDHLDGQVTKGFHSDVVTEPEDDQDEDAARARLLDALLGDNAGEDLGADAPPATGSDLTSRPGDHTGGVDLATLAERAGWSLPAYVVVMRVTFHGTFPAVRLDGDPLLRMDTSPGFVVCDANDAETLSQQVFRVAPGLRVTVSWPVAPQDAADAARWATRALRLVDKGVIPPLPVVNCADHAIQMWLHAEPLLRQQLAQDLLAPLLAETPNSREILSETMLAWLESRDSAPAIAGKLGVHPQTVRYRWKRINELFGELLHDPEFVITVTMLLKATVPMWKAGDQADVAHFRAARGTS